MDKKQLRFCKSINCKNLDGLECEVKECEHIDREKAVEEFRQAVKDGG